MANKKREPDEKIPDWYPLQLRHTRANEVRNSYGLDGAQAALRSRSREILVDEFVPRKLNRTTKYSDSHTLSRSDSYFLFDR